MRVSKWLSLNACLVVVGTIGACASTDNGGGTAPVAGINPTPIVPIAPGTTGAVPPTGSTATPGGVSGSGSMVVTTLPPVGAGTGGAPAGTGGAPSVNMMMPPVAHGEGTTGNVKIEYNDPNMKCY